MAATGRSTKDYIAPSSFDFTGKRHFEMGDTFCAVSCVEIAASQLADVMLKDFLDMECGQIVTIHVRSLDQNAAIKMVKHKITELDSKYDYVDALPASKGMLYECVDGDTFAHDLVDWHGNVLLSGAMRFSLASNGNYLISQEDYSSFTLYQVNGASPAALANSEEGAA